MGKYFRARTLLVSKLGQNEWHNGKNSLMCHYHQIQGYFNYQLKRKTQERHKMELLKNWQALVKFLTMTAINFIKRLDLKN